MQTQTAAIVGAVRELGGLLGGYMGRLIAAALNPTLTRAVQGE